MEGKAQLRREVDPDEIRELKKQPGKDMAVGGANLASVFLKHGLVDEFRLYIHPVSIGGGKPMFPISERMNLEFVESRIFPGGVVMNKYQLEKA